MNREDVEALVELCESGHPALVDTPIRLTRREAAALGRRWLAVEDAKVVTFWSGDRDGEFCVDSPEQADAIQTGQRVRIVPTPNTTEGE